MIGSESQVMDNILSQPNDEIIVDGNIHTLNTHQHIVYKNQDIIDENEIIVDENACDEITYVYNDASVKQIFKDEIVVQINDSDSSIEVIHNYVVQVNDDINNNEDADDDPKFPLSDDDNNLNVTSINSSTDPNPSSDPGYDQRGTHSSTMRGVDKNMVAIDENTYDYNDDNVHAINYNYAVENVMKIDMDNHNDDDCDNTVESVI